MLTDRQLKKIALGFRKGILRAQSSFGTCMMVSAPLQGFLSAVYGVETVLETIDFTTGNHVWLRLPDGRILDATADQFGLEAVYLGAVPECYKELMK